MNENEKTLDREEKKSDSAENKNDAKTEKRETETDKKPAADTNPSPDNKPADKAASLTEQNSSRLLTVTSSPHIRTSDTSRSIMIDVLIALMPSLIWAVYLFGFRSLTLTLIAVLSCVAFEAIYQLIMRKPVTVLDCSACVTGVLLAFKSSGGACGRFLCAQRGVVNVLLHVFGDFVGMIGALFCLPGIPF